MALLLAGFSALLYGIADFSGGFAAGRSRLLPVLLVSQVVGLATALAAVAALATLGHGLPTRADLAWSCLAGLFGAMGLVMLWGGIAKSIVAIVSPASAVVGAVIPVLFAVLSGERPSATALAGCALCLPAILLLSWEQDAGEHHRHGSVRSALVYGILAGLGFGIFFVALSRAGARAGLWPVVAARVASLLAFLIAWAAAREPFKLERNALAPTLLAGAADMGANILFLLATQCGMLSLVAMITALFPAPTVILARIFLKQRIPPLRFAGLVLALSGAALISVR